MKPHVLLDLDGTVLDSKPGVIRCVNHALNALGAPTRDESELVVMIGPPLHLGFPQFLGTDDEQVVAAAIAAYRERYQDVGIFEANLFPGVREMIQKLGSDGYHLSLVTAKPEPYAVRLVEHFELQNQLRGVYAPSLDDKRDGKSHLIQRLLENEGLPPSGAIMVGDRNRDIDSANRVGVRSVGVLWGYGSREELMGCEPTGLVETPQELVTWIQSH